MTTGFLLAEQLPLNEAIKQSARGIEEELPRGTKVFVVNFNSPAAKFSEYIVEELTSELIEGRKLIVVDRSNLNTIRQELNLSLSGEISDKSALSIGRMLGAQNIITGTLTEMGTFHRFRLRIINTETAAIQRQITNELQNNENNIESSKFIFGSRGYFGLGYAF